MIKILHTADWHANSNFEKFLESTKFIKDYIENNHIDLMVFSGDLFDSKIIASDIYNKIINRFVEFADLVPIFMVYGTPSHDYKGSLDILKEIKTKYEIYIVDTMKNTMMYFSDSHFNNTHDVDESVLLVGLPWQLKSRFLKDSELYNLNVSEQNKLYRKRFNQWRNIVLKEKTKKIPTILVGHLQLEGTVYSAKQDISNDNHQSEDYLDLCDYGALGHIHKSQNIKHLYYSGSIYNKSWGELEDKYFNVITIDNKIKEVEQIKIPTPILLKLECSLDEYKIIKEDIKNEQIIRTDNGTYDCSGLVNLWLIVNIDKKILNFENELKFWKEQVNEIRLEFSKIKTETVQRLENYNSKISLVDKYKLWCKQKSIEPTEFQINKIKELK